MKKLIEISELEKCPCFNLRTMARQLTNNYNNSLKVIGINATQIPILALLNIYNQIEISKISDLLNLDPSTIRRNSSILIKKRFIKIVKRNFKGNTLTLTEKGYNTLKKILPIWKKSNIEGKKLLRDYVQVLNKI
ncbi:MAG: hypothetical protein CBC25_08555 [Pelagibacteraceae bacterium TMED65]|nr:hypothetical protein [Rickettsiales bacterium]OUU50308.1 MAG: hypothetical protein CBC25_08555 [Pelagibacteraceae bacterium TMED65]